MIHKIKIRPKILEQPPLEFELSFEFSSEDWLSQYLVNRKKPTHPISAMIANVTMLQIYKLFSRFRRFIFHKQVVLVLSAKYSVIAGNGVHGHERLVETVLQRGKSRVESRECCSNTLTFGRYRGVVHHGLRCRRLRSENSRCCYCPRHIGGSNRADSVSTLRIVKSLQQRAGSGIIDKALRSDPLPFVNDTGFLVLAAGRCETTSA